MIRRAAWCLLFAALGAAAEPNLTLIDGPGNVGQFSSVAGLSSGMFVSYYDADNGDLKVATCTSQCDRAGSPWTASTVDSAGDVGLYTSMGSVGGNPAIAYYDATNKALKLAICTANCTTATPAWTLTTVDRGSADTGRYPTLLGGDNPRIVYYDRANGDLKLATCMAACATSGAAWTFATIDSAGDVGRFAVARSDFFAGLEIAYADASNGRLKMAICTAGCTTGSPTWLFHVVDQLTVSGEMHLSLALNEGAPSISYHDAANGGLKLATCNTSCGTSTPQWVVSVIDRAGDAGQWSALVLNGHVPGIAYSAVIRSCNGSVCHEVDELRFAVCGPLPGHATSDMPCAIGTVDSDMAGLHPSMLRSGDSVFMTYYDARGRDLKIAYTHMDEGFPSQQNYTSLWWDPEEAGWGINFSHQGDIVFGTLFTYDASGQPMWLVMSAGRKQSARVFSGELYRTTGPAFDAQPFTPIGPGNITPVGTMTVAFAADFAALTYTVNGITVNKTLRRQAFAAQRAPGCGDNTSTPSGFAGSFQGLWWNPNESGWGINFAQQGGVLFGTLFTYDAGGRGTWFVMSSGRKQADGSFVGELYRTSGPAFDAAPFTPIGPAQIVQVGMMQVTFTDPNSGTLTYSVNGITVTKSITRQVFSSPQPVCGGG